MSTALRLALVLALAMGLGTLTTLPTLSQSGNPIVIENQQPGTDQWNIPNNGYSLSDDTSNQIKGYASATSVNKGGALGISVTVNPAQSFTIAFYRMGWYGGFSDIGVGSGDTGAVWSGPPSFVWSHKVWPSRVMTAAMWRART
jgi:hypothetical protein